MNNHYVPERGPDGRILTDDMTAFHRNLTGQQPATTAPRDEGQPLRPRLSRQQVASIVAVPLIIGIVVYLALQLLTRTPAIPPDAIREPKRAGLPTATMPTQNPTPAAILHQAIVVYAAPDGQVLGAVEGSRAYTITARYGENWIQLDVTGSGKVWVHRAAFQPDPVALATLPDLEPPPAPTPEPQVIQRPAVVQYIAPQDCSPLNAVGHANSIHGEVWSCVSQADADAQIAHINADAERK